MTEQEIIKHLVSEYHPKAILLAGSRATGQHAPDSDWDLYIFTEEGGPKETIKRVKGEVLDITFRIWPQPPHSALTNAYSPLTVVKILFDDTEGALDALIERTQAIAEQGPRGAYALACDARKEKLGRWLSKIQKFRDQPSVQFFYVGHLYQLALRVWFENRNQWPLPPEKGLPYMQQKDAHFYQKLELFKYAKAEDVANIAFEIESLLKSS